MSPLTWESYSQSSEKKVTAAKKPTVAGCALWNEGMTSRIENTTVKVGTKITVGATLHERVNGLSPLDKTMKVYHRIGNGAWGQIKTVITGTTTDHPPASHGGADFIYTLAEPGEHLFYTEFEGDSEYEGCEKAVRLLAR